MVQSFILAHFNYCPLVWYFTSARQINKIEKIEEKALRYISDDYNSNYQQLLENNKFVSMEIKRKQTRIFPNKSSFPYNLRSSDDLLVPRVNQTTFELKSIRYEGAVLWNHLPKNIKSSDTFGTFKKQIKSQTGLQCKCTHCKFVNDADLCN